MRLTEKQEMLLHQVLGQLMTAYTIGAKELFATHAYLFGEVTVAPFFTDMELFETVKYLREVIVTNALTLVEELSEYYERKKEKYRSYLEDITKDTLCSGKVEATTYEADLQIRVSEGIVIAASDIYRMNRQINLISLRYWESVSEKMTHFFSPQSLPRSGENDVHATVKKYVRGLMDGNQRHAADHTFSIDVSLPGSIQHYVAQFAAPDHQIVLIQFKDTWPNTGLQKWLSDYREFFASDVLGAICGNFSGRRMPDYAAIIDVLRKEEPIEDNSFKIMLTEWLVYSKMVISRSEWQDVVQPVCAGTNLAVDSLAGNECVRVYGYMHDWVLNLYTARLSRKKWIILKRLSNHYWLTSDNPGFVVNIGELSSGFTEFIPRHSLSDIRADSIMYYPLSKDYCLKLEPIVEAREDAEADVPIDYIEPTEEELEFVNGVTVSTYKKVLITNQRGTLDQTQL